VREIVVQTNAKLSGPGLENQWRLMLLHQYRSRVLTALGPGLFTADPEVQDFVKTTATELLDNHIPATLDVYLTPTQRGRAELARAGRWELLQTLVGVDSGLVGISTATAVDWVDGKLEITAESRWRRGRRGRSGDPVRRRPHRARPTRRGGRRPADEALDMTAALRAATTAFGVRARDTGVTWMLPGTCEPRIGDAEGSARAGSHRVRGAGPVDRRLRPTAGQDRLGPHRPQRAARSDQPAQPADDDAGPQARCRTGTSTSRTGTSRGCSVSMSTRRSGA
jgi:hypothetical protein